MVVFVPVCEWRMMRISFLIIIILSTMSEFENFKALKNTSKSNGGNTLNRKLL